MASTAAFATALAAGATPTAGPEAVKISSTATGKPPLRFRHPDYTHGDAPPSPESSENEYSDGEGETTAVDDYEDNYVRKVLAKERPLPPITWKNWYKEIQIISTLALTVVPALAIYGAYTTPMRWQTLLWAVVYYFYTGLGITAGYHRLWAHRSYTASKPLEWFLMFGGSGAVEGSVKWWARGHRAHHRYTDTELDPYSAQKGFLWSHIGWMIVKPRRRPGVADVSDLSVNSVLKWQHKHYVPLIILMGFVFPTLVAGLGWDDWKGGFFFAGAARLLFVHHSTFCVNSLAHWLGDAPFDDKHTPRDHMITAFVTVGEGYHNFHHQYPSDYRNAIKWYQYDPTKWFIATMSYFGLASQLKKFPTNEIKKGQLAMTLKGIKDQANQISWPEGSNDLPVITWDQFAEESKHRNLVVIAGFVHDVTNFIDEHPGGRAYIKTRLGKDATAAFYGGVYDHSNAANNVLAMLRVGCIDGGYEVESLKQYSEVINSLKISGDAALRDAKNTDPKAGMKGIKEPRRTVAIKGDPTKKTSALLPQDQVPKMFA